MSERFHPDGDRIPEPEVDRAGLLARARGHLMDVTPLRTSRDFRSLFIGRSISDFGDGVVEVVVPFQVYDLTHSTLAVGLLGLCALIPVFVFPIVGGAVADAVERRRLVVITHAFLAVLSLLLAVNALQPEPKLWPLYVFATLSAGVGTFNRPALSTWPARLLDPALLPSANALESGIGSLDYMIAPVVAGVLIAVIEPAGVFLLDVVTFLAVIAMVLRMRPSPPAEDAERFGWASIKGGFRFLRGKRTIQSVFLADLNAMVFGFPLALFPAVAADRLGGGPVLLGLLYGAIAAGSLLASVFSGRAKHVRRQGRAIMVAIAVWGAAIVVFGFSTTAWLSIAMLTIAGAGDMVSGIFRMSILQAAVEDRFRGRLDGIGMAVWATGPALGDVEGGGGGGGVGVGGGGDGPAARRCRVGRRGERVERPGVDRLGWRPDGPGDRRPAMVRAGVLALRCAQPDPVGGAGCSRSAPRSTTRSSSSTSWRRWSGSAPACTSSSRGAG